MRIAFARNKYAIEKDDRISKTNFGLRLEYLIEPVILHKRLVYDNSKLTNEITIHNMTDLEAYYDR